MNERTKAYWLVCGWYGLAGLGGGYAYLLAAEPGTPAWPAQWPLPFWLVLAVGSRFLDAASTIMGLEVPGVYETAPGLGREPEPGTLLASALTQSVLIALATMALAGLQAAGAVQRPWAEILCVTITLAGVGVAGSNLWVAGLAWLKASSRLLVLLGRLVTMFCVTVAFYVAATGALDGTAVICGVTAIGNVIVLLPGAEQLPILSDLVNALMGETTCHSTPTRGWRA